MGDEEYKELFEQMYVTMFLLDFLFFYTNFLMVFYSIKIMYSNLKTTFRFILYISLTEKIMINKELKEPGILFVNSVVQLLERLLDYRYGRDTYF